MIREHRLVSVGTGWSVKEDVLRWPLAEGKFRAGDEAMLQ